MRLRIFSILGIGCMILLGLIPLFSHNQSMVKIEGRVIAKWVGTPVENAAIVIDRYITTTDANGYFSMDVPSGTYTLRVIRVDFWDYEATITIPTPPLIIELQPKVVMLPR